MPKQIVGLAGECRPKLFRLAAAGSRLSTFHGARLIAASQFKRLGGLTSGPRIVLSQVGIVGRGVIAPRRTESRSCWRRPLPLLSAAVGDRRRGRPGSWLSV